MKLTALAVIGIVALALAPAAGAADRVQPVLVIHGGAGAMPRAEMSADRETAYRAGLDAALDAGFAILERGGSSLDAVVEVVRMLEDDPQFNAGRGAVLNHDGLAELDASLMDGRTLQAGSVAGVSHVKNPILLARLVMEKSVHVMLIGTGAEEFALENGVTLVANTYFHTEHRKLQLERAKARVIGTVGAVALDANGNLAAATSTGGMENKRFGRVGDSPIIGAGTYADNSSCAVSATGRGEYFIRAAVAHDICARVAYARVPLQQAAREVIQDKLRKLGGTGGVIALDARGSVVMEFNTDGMFRGVKSAGRREVAIYR
ncbi:MAG: isoaspartyl peptidase/L-asparaginase family protein [Steroidobacteraceae bacterium]